MNEDLVAKQLEECQKELHNIELTNDKSRRERWRELKRFEKYAKRKLGI
ncbi:MAG: hypothetical protein J6I84_04185 [Bacilli bacterium]|nr:hypothetical protein [Bacilli bacterium]